MSNATAKIIEKIDVERDYGLIGTALVIDHEKHGRLLLNDGFGGIDTPAGGAVRWRHGMAVKLLPSDTIESLQSTPWNDYASTYDAVLAGHDKNRPVLDWTGDMVERLAKFAL